MKLSLLQHQALYVINWAGKLYRWPGGYWLPYSPKKYRGSVTTPNQQLRDQGVVFITNTIASLERRGLIEPSRYGMDILATHVDRVPRVITDAGQQVINELGAPNDRDS